MKIRIVGTKKEFEQISEGLFAVKDKFDKWRKPQTGGNPRYKEGGDKYDPKQGEQLLMYLEITPTKLKNLLKRSNK